MIGLRLPSVREADRRDRFEVSALLSATHLETRSNWMMADARAIRKRPVELPD